jgi:aminobenzoyl-glutamate utilization protein B
MERYRPELKKYYYDPSRYKTYLEQLGIEYPTLRKPTGASGAARLGVSWSAGGGRRAPL